MSKLPSIPEYHGRHRRAVEEDRSDGVLTAELIPMGRVVGMEELKRMLPG